MAMHNLIENPWFFNPKKRNIALSKHTTENG